jgi:hypothetical protein
VFEQIQSPFTKKVFYLHVKHDETLQLKHFGSQFKQVLLKRYWLILHLVQGLPSSKLFDIGKHWHIYKPYFEIIIDLPVLFKHLTQPI